MKFDLFKKVIEDFKKFPQKLKVVRMYGFGEPLLNPNFPAMVAYAKKSGVCESTDTTSNGSRLNPWLNRQIVAAGLDAINISVPAMTSEKILESTGAKIDFDAYVANIADLYDHKEQLRINLKIINYTFTDDEKQFFYDTFGDICDEIGIENAIPQWDGQTEAGFNATNPDINVYYLPIIPAIVCPWIFYMSVIHANGDICACFGDWHHDNLMGNIKTDSFFDVWNGELRKQLLIDHLTLHRDRHPLCDRCHITTLCQPDIIDPYREEILARFL